MKLAEVEKRKEGKKLIETKQTYNFYEKAKTYANSLIDLKLKNYTGSKLEKKIKIQELDSNSKSGSDKEEKESDTDKTEEFSGDSSVNSNGTTIESGDYGTHETRKEKKSK